MKLRAPLKTLLQSPIDDSSVARIRAGVATRERARARPARATVAFAVAVAAAIAIAVVARPGTPGALGPVTAGGAALGVLEADVTRAVALDDGSTVSLRAGTRVVARTNDGRELVLDLERGSIELDVRPGTGRRWMIETGWATVEVVGTQFVVTRDDLGVEVSVSRGEVVVRGEQVVGRVRHLVAGQMLRVEGARLDVRTAGPTEPPIARSAPEDPAPAPAGRAADVEARRSVSPRDRDRAAAGEPIDTGRGEVTELLARADAVRLEARPSEAADLLAMLVRDHADDPRAAVAAFTLARLQLDVLDEPGEAVTNLERAITLGLPAGTLEDARARMVEALARSGRLDDARAAAVRFEAEHSESPRLPQVRAWAARESP